jgi:ankyrin repeat protein
LASNVKLAAESGNVRNIRRWLAGEDTDVDARGNFSRTALHFAAQGGHCEVVRMLLEAGGDSSAEDEGRGTPLHLAAKSGHGLVVKLLLDGGSNGNAIDMEGKSAIEYAQGSGNVGCVLLIQRRLNVDSTGGGANPVRLRSKQGVIDDAV